MLRAASIPSRHQGCRCREKKNRRASERETVRKVIKYIGSFCAQIGHPLHRLQPPTRGLSFTSLSFADCLLLLSVPSLTLFDSGRDTYCFYILYSSFVNHTGVMPLRYNSSSAFSRPSAPRGIDLGHATGSGHHIPPQPQHHHQQRPPFPISPPDTQVNTPATADAKSLVDPISAPEESPADRFRRVTNIAYNHARRPSARSQEIKPTRWLVVVVPPSTLNSEPVLGHTLSTAPPGRFTTGILMPLFPTVCHILDCTAFVHSCPNPALWPTFRDRKRIRATQHQWGLCLSSPQ